MNNNKCVICGNAIGEQNESVKLCTNCYKKHRRLYRRKKYLIDNTDAAFYGIWFGITVDVIIGIIEKFM